MQCEISLIEMACFIMRVYNWISGNKNMNKMHCSLLISGFEFHHRVGRMPTRSSTSFTPCLFNGTLCCLVMGQSSAILLFQLVCLKGSLWLSMEGLLSVTRKIKVRQTAPPEHCFFLVQRVSILTQDFYIIFMIHNWGSGNTDVCIGKQGKSILAPCKGRDLLWKWRNWIFWHDLLLCIYGIHQYIDDLPVCFKRVCWVILVLERTKQPLLPKMTQWHEKHRVLQ